MIQRIGRRGSSQKVDGKLIKKTAKLNFFGENLFDVIAPSVASNVEDGLDTSGMNGESVLLIKYTVRWKGFGSGSWEPRLRAPYNADLGILVSDFFSEAEFDEAPQDEFKSKTYPLGIIFIIDGLETTIRMGNENGQSGSELDINHELEYAYIER